MRLLTYTLIGAVFGVGLYKGEVISWFRIQEMFHFQSFHMYGVIGSGVATAAVLVRLMTRGRARDLSGAEIKVAPKPLNRGTILGGLIFGLGWALTGACPGPLYAHVGAGTSVMIVALAAAIFGAWVYAVLRPKLPH